MNVAKNKSRRNLSHGKQCRTRLYCTRINTNTPSLISTKHNIHFEPNVRHNARHYMKNSNDDDIKASKQKVSSLISNAISRVNNNAHHEKFAANVDSSTESRSSINNDVTNLVDTAINRAESILQSKENIIEASTPAKEGQT